MASRPPLLTVGDLLARYQALLIDAYGVLVEHHGALPGARELLERLDAEGRPYLIVTNDASRLPATRAAWFARHGLRVPEERIVSSGMLLGDYYAGRGLQGAATMVLGPPDAAAFVRDAGGVVVPLEDEADADVLVVSDDEGFPFLEGFNAALTMCLRRLDAGRRLHLVLPNPDLLYPRGGARFGVASGGVAAMLEAVLASRYPGRDDLRFTRLGKPHPALFEGALQRLGTRDAVMLGDQLATDIAGALAVGIDAALVVGGGVVTSVDDLPPSGPRPTCWLRGLTG